jgi:hypothetical protein
MYPPPHMTDTLWILERDETDMTDTSACMYPPPHMTDTLWILERDETDMTD